MSKPGVVPFGAVDGAPVQQITLQSDSGLVAQVLTWGAVLRDLAVPMPGRDPLGVVLGFDDIAPYPLHSPYFGAVIGRYANRIAGGRFTLDGVTYDLDRNEDNRTTLHGGRGGFSQRIWRILDVQPDAVTLGLTSPDGDQGFPGRLEVTCRYALGPGHRLSIGFQAHTDRATPVNLTHHAYFNLDGGADIADHLLCIHADSYTPAAADNIPTGQVLPVQATRFDFRQPRTVIDPQGGYDQNFVLRQGGAGLHPAATLTTRKSGLRLHLQTTKPGLQFYDGHHIAVPVPGLGGRPYGPKAGLCLEPQFFPDSPNIAAFPDTILQPGMDYQHSCQFDFDHDGADGPSVM